MVKNYEGFFKTVVESGVVFKVRHTDITEMSVLFDKEVVNEEINEDQNQLEINEAPEQDAEENNDQPEEQEDKKDEEVKDKVEEADSKNNEEAEKKENTEQINEGEGQPAMEGEGLDQGEGEHDPEEEEEEAEKEPEEILPEFPYDPSKKMNYDEFINFYQEEIEGRLDRRKVIREFENPPTNEEDEEDKEGEEDNEKKPANEGEGNEGEGEGDKEVTPENEEDEKEAEQQAEREHQERMVMEEKAKEISLKQQEAWKNYQEVNFEKGFIVIEDGSGYVLAVHPSPPMSDVLILFYQGGYDDSEDIITYKDYGVTERQENVEIPHEMIDLVSRQEKVVAAPVSGINTSQFDIMNPLTPDEWKRWYDITSATKGYGFVQVLPVGYTSNQTFKNNLLHIFPKKEKAWKDFNIPLNVMITLREQFYKKENKRLFETNQKRKEDEAKAEENPMPLSQAEMEAEEERKRQEEAENEHIHKYSSKNIFKLDEFNFPH